MTEHVSSDLAFVRRAVAESVEHLREALVARPRKLSGYAAVFNSETTIHSSFGAFREVIRPGAFTRALRESQDVVAWFQHGSGSPLPLGRTKSGTLRLSQDSRGLAFEVDLPASSAADDLVESVRRGDISEASFAFEPHTNGGERWTPGTAGGPDLRELLSVAVFDVAPVVFAAYRSTCVGLRSPVADDHKSVDVDHPAPAEQPVANQAAALEGARLAIAIERLRDAETT